ncbi:MAG TPA: AI-2E family transporter [Parvularculaceae bacterium]|nr:AI-2E family transporter [Parvularculaceae bacterium]
MPEEEAPSGASSREARVFFSLALAALIGFLAFVGRGILIPVVFAGFASFLIYTLKETIKKGPIVGRFLPNWLCYLFAFAAIASILLFFAEIIRDNVEKLIAEAPLYEARLRNLTHGAIDAIEAGGLVPADFAASVDQLRQNALSLIQPLLGQIGGSARSITANFVTVFLYTAFLLIERGRIFKKIALLSADERQRRVVDETIGDIGAMVREYITVKSAVNLVMAIAGYLILRLLGVDFPGFWALLLFVLNFIPIIGAVIAVAAPALLALVEPEGGARLALLTLALLFAVEQVMSSAIEPRLVGRSLNLSPLVILFALALWGALWGFAGLLLAVPITVTIMIVMTQFQPTRPIAILMSDSGEIAPIKRPAT